MKSRPFLPLFSGALLCGAILSPRGALAGDSALARNSASKSVQIGVQDSEIHPISQREFADAATTQIEFLKELRAWRNTLRGGGARREFGFSPLGGQKMAISLGQVAPSEMGGGAGVAARWKGLEIGTTAQPDALDGVLNGFDAVLTGEKVNVPNPMQLHWLRAKLSESKGVQIEVMAARAERDTNQKSGWRGADFQSARARFQLPAKWSLNGDFSRAEVENRARNQAENEAASAWSIAAAGPIAHPFGVASARASWNDVGAGYLAPTAQNGALGGRNGALELDQDLKIGVLSGNLGFGASTRRRAQDQSAQAGDELLQNGARGAANLALALTPNLAVTGQGHWDSAAATRALRGQNEAQNQDANLLAPAQGRELSRGLAGDVGLRWNFSKALSISATMGLSSQDSHLEVGQISTPGTQSDEVRRALEIRQKSGSNDLRLRFSQRARQILAPTANLSQNATGGSLSGGFNGGSKSGLEAPISQWRIEAVRPLLGGVRLKTILDFASDEAKNQSARRIEAQFQLARALRFDARYRQGDLAPGLLSDEWSSTFAVASGAPKQVSARFGVGSAAAGAGLGFSLEMVRSQGALPDSYRVGLQFK